MGPNEPELPEDRTMTQGQDGASAAGAGSDEETLLLVLYVAGQSPRSLTAFANLKKVCEEHLQGRYNIQVIDLIEQPHLARRDQIVAIPTLVRKLPEPIRKIIGDLSNTEKVLVGLQILPRPRT